MASFSRLAEVPDLRVVERGMPARAFTSCRAEPPESLTGQRQLADKLDEPGSRIASNRAAGPR